MNYCVYVITNTVNGKKYVGFTKITAEKRWGQHVSDSRRDSRKHIYFYKAINKYGATNFVVETIDSSLSKAKATQYEKDVILFLNTTCPENGYNTTEGGEGGRQTSEVREIMSQNIKAWWTPERREEKRLAMLGENGSFYGKKHTEETKALIGQKNSTKTRTPEHKAAMSWEGKKHTESAKNNMSEARKKKWADPEYVLKQTGRSEESLKRTSESGRAAWARKKAAQRDENAA